MRDWELQHTHGVCIRASLWDKIVALGTAQPTHKIRRDLDTDTDTVLERARILVRCHCVPQHEICRN